jgi:hypothetical protein
MTENRRQRTDGREQMAESRRQRTDDSGQRDLISEFGIK